RPVTRSRDAHRRVTGAGEPRHTELSVVGQRQGRAGFRTGMQGPVFIGDPQWLAEGGSVVVRDTQRQVALITGIHLAPGYINVAVAVGGYGRPAAGASAAADTHPVAPMGALIVGAGQVNVEGALRAAGITAIQP